FAPVGRHKLRNRQSSDVFSLIVPVVRGQPACAQSAQNLLASRTPSHAATGCGGRQRYSPTGAAAYGIPLKLSTLSSVTPRTIPDAVRTVGSPREPIWPVCCACKLKQITIANPVNIFFI